MRLSFILLLTLWPCFSAVAQSPSSPAPTPLRILTADDLRKFLVGTTWSWQYGWGNQQTTPVSFADDGTAHTDYWTAKFTVKNATEIELHLDHRTAKLTFDSTYKHYQGKDFDKSPVQGAPSK